ncbi:hypothetical protein J6590_029011 [Homalodisca vitripennis]|nr:hypothetical protein J6590_029011 [Homalodisca vitripennis]
MDLSANGLVLGQEWIAKALKDVNKAICVCERESHYPVGIVGHVGEARTGIVRVIWNNSTTSPQHE